MALGIVKYAYYGSSQLIGVIWFAVSLWQSVVVNPLLLAILLLDYESEYCIRTNVDCFRKCSLIGYQVL